MKLPKPEDQHPLPEPSPAVRRAEFLQALKPGQSFVVPKAERGVWALTARRCGVKVTSRQEDGEAALVRIWRTE